jgi:hypothetical protein
MIIPIITQLQKRYIIATVLFKIPTTHTLPIQMCLFNLFSKHEEKNDLPPPRPANLGRRTPEATSRLQGSKFSSDASRRSSSDNHKYGHGSGNGSLGVGGPHGGPHGGIYGGVNGGIYSGVSGGPNGGVNGGVYGGVSGTSSGGGLAPGGMGTSPGGGYGYL